MSRKSTNLNGEQRDVQDYLDRPYARIIVHDAESRRYTAQILEFEGCIAEGATHSEAYENLTDAAAAWVESALARGIHIPGPLASHGFAGAIALRLPKGLHRRAAQFAQREGVSLNQFLVSATAAHVGAEEAVERLARRLDERFQEFVANLDERLGEILPRTGRGRMTVTSTTIEGDATTLDSAQLSQLVAGVMAHNFLFDPSASKHTGPTRPLTQLLSGGEREDADS